MIYHHFGKGTYGIILKLYNTTLAKQYLMNKIIKVK